ncbi:helix-turn-helix domain-containing protein [Sphingorhabdus sp. 109]|uniref:helix-turn-helix domain-containing protein n=1 Tax=Sphingorhabdus sp. 109 TaxID=2653173 RepID=UPI0012F23AB7|nr:helix-turn-helix domain-containing protein [Sphingorhabdus sp. 109]VWX62520.1 conserved hypothetical protein [Sphingorhabdus sp. 109]
MTMLGPFGLRLRQERIRLGLNQQEFGERAGVSKNSISSYEKGERPANVVFLMVLEDIGVDVGFVLTGNRGDDSLTVEQQHLVGMFESLSARERSAVIALLTQLTGNGIELTELASGRSQVDHSERDEYNAQDKD